MAKRKQELETVGNDMPYLTRDRLVQRMDEMAYRRPDLESVILQLARVGELSEVEKAILKRREYAKRRNA